MEEDQDCGKPRLGLVSSLRREDDDDSIIVEPKLVQIKFNWTTYKSITFSVIFRITMTDSCHSMPLGLRNYWIDWFIDNWFIQSYTFSWIIRDTAVPQGLKDS